MKTNFKTLFVVSLFSLSFSCVSATATIEQICSDKTTVISAAPLELASFVGVRTVESSYDEDFSGALFKATDIGDVSIDNIQLDISGNVSFIQRVRVGLSMKSLQNSILLSDTVFKSQPKDTINIPVTADKVKLFDMLSSGAVTLTVSFTGFIPTEETSLNKNLCIGVSAKVNRSVF